MKKPVTREEAAVQQIHAEAALDLLVQAREHLKYSKNPKTLGRVRLAISSCKGAIRNCGYRGRD